MQDPFNISGKICVVTGGLGLLGSRFCRALAERGAKVAVLDSHADPARFRELFGAEAGNMLYVCADVTRKATLETALTEIRKHWGVAEVLINGAALDSPPSAPASENGPFESYPESSFDKIMEVNVKGVFLSCQVFGKAMAEAGKGSIVNIGSIYGMVSPDQRLYEHRRKHGEKFFKPVTYSISKSGLLNLTRYLATYWASRGVRVNTLTFGGVHNNQDTEFLKGYCERVPLGRMAQPDEYNGAVVFLASEASSYMTGANLVMDGGWTAW